MANPETIINSIRNRCTAVFEACQENLSAVSQDKDDFAPGDPPDTSFFTDWFAEAQTDITFQQLAEAVQAMATLEAAFENVRSKLQLVRTR
jgi:hypothetical protein